MQTSLGTAGLVFVAIFLSVLQNLETRSVIRTVTQDFPGDAVLKSCCFTAVAQVPGGASKPFPGGFPGGSVVKNTPANAGHMGLIPELGRFPEGENGNPLQYSCLGNTMRGAWRVTVHGVAMSQTQLGD